VAQEGNLGGGRRTGTRDARFWKKPTTNMNFGMAVTGWK
jgi:hypothetical protein